MSLLSSWLESLELELKISSKCVREISPKATCQLCVNECPEQSILIMNGKVELHSEKCSKCGNCLIVCPVGAITGPIPNRQFKNGRLLYDESYVPTKKELLVYHKLGVRKVFADRHMAEKWETVLDEANKMVVMLDGTTFEVEEDTYVPTMSRRGFFKTATASTKNLAKEFAPAAWRWDHNSWNPAQYYPEHQFFQVNLEMSLCNLCGTCFSLCPTKAIYFQGQEIVIDHSKCLDCRLCSDACQEKAISIEEKISTKTTWTAPFLQKECKSCGYSFKTFNESEEECFVCSRRDNNWLTL